MQVKYIIALLFALVIATFALLNAQPVTVDFAFNEFQISLALVILVSAFAGAIILGFLGLFRQVKEGFKNRETGARLKRSEERLKEAEEKLAITGAELDVAKANLAERDDRIKGLAERVAEKDGRIKELTVNLTEKDKRIKELIDCYGKGNNEKPDIDEKP